MRIKKLHIYGFGNHTNRVIEFDEQFNFLYGLNEAGKTTMYEFILQILFGFPQKNHLIKSYEPKQGGAFGGAITISDEQFGDYVVERVGGKAGGIVTVQLADGRSGEEELLQQLLKGYSRSDVEAVFAFSMHQLQHLDKMTEDELNRTLLASGTTGVDQLTALEKQLSKESATLFKKSGQNPIINKQVKELQLQEDGLKKERQKLAEYEPKQATLLEWEQKIIELEKVQAKLSEEIQYAQQYVQSEPLIKKREALMQTLSAMKEQSFPLKGIQLFEQSDVRLQQVQQELIHLERRFIDLKKELNDVVNEEQLEQLKMWLLSDEQWREWRMRRDQLIAQQQQIETQIEMKKQLLGIEKSMSKVDSSLVNEVGFKKKKAELDELNQESKYYKQALEEAQRQKPISVNNNENSRQNKAQKKEQQFKIPLLVSGMMLLFAFIVALLLQQWLIVLLGIVVAFISFIFIRNQLGKPVAFNQPSYVQNLDEKIADLNHLNSRIQEQKAGILDELQVYFVKLGITGTIEEEIHDELFQNIRMLQEKTVEQLQIDSQLDQLQQQIARHYEMGLSYLQREVPESELSPFIQQLVQQQEIALKKMSYTLEQLTEVEQQRAVIEKQKESLEAQQQQLFSQANVSDQQAFYAVAQQVEERQQLQQQVQQLEQQLKTIEGIQVYTVSQLDDLQAHYELNKEHYADALKQHSMLLAEVQHLVKDNRYSLLLQQQEQGKAELEINIKNWVQVKIIEEAINQTLGRLKEQKLPSVLAQATNYFSFLTEDKYSSLNIDGDRFIAITKDNMRFSIGELSQATKEQAYLALRLALANEKAKQASFPFILDDPFVHFDTLRTSKVVQLLRKIQRNHQILFFSCQERMKVDFIDQNIIEVRALQTKGD